MPLIKFSNVYSRVKTSDRVFSGVNSTRQIFALRPCWYSCLQKESNKVKKHAVVCYSYRLSRGTWLS